MIKLIYIYVHSNQQKPSSKGSKGSKIDILQTSPSFPRAQQRFILQKRQQLHHLLGFPQQDPGGPPQHLAMFLEFQPPTFRLN